MTGPFTVLGLPASRDLTDDEVRAAWRRVAAATHPDRSDGGNPAAFAAAAAAYTILRTQSGRGEALADLQQAAGGRDPRQHVPVRKAAPGVLLAGPAWRIRHGRPGRLAIRLLAAGAAGALAVGAAGWQPASYAVITGALTWLILTAHGDLAAPDPPR